MDEFRCVNCGKPCDGKGVYICSECGAFLCADCCKNELCPHCYGRASRLS